MYPAPRKRFGQNFLQDPAVIARIITAISPKPGERLVEIGPGRGAITLDLLTATGKLEAVELDPELIDSLAKRCEGKGSLTLHHADALHFDLCHLLRGDERIRLVGNLPYNISTPLLFHFLVQRHCLLDMHFMLQKEVVDRIVAPPGSRTYGRLSVMVQTWCQADALFTIPPQAFYPAPQVESAFFRLIPYGSLPFPVTNPSWHEWLVAQAFSQRRKTLRNTLKGWVSEAIFHQLEIDAGQRAEALSVASFAKLANLTCKTLPPPENC